MKRFAALAVLTFALAACETASVGPAPPPPTANIPPGELDLGDWRNANEATTLRAFQDNAAARYAPGVRVNDATRDLAAQDFRCGDAPAQDNGRGDPPAQVCRRTVTQSNCTHTWQVHLYGESALARARGLYDRRCGGEGLLGGPGGG